MNKNLVRKASQWATPVPYIMYVRAPYQLSVCVLQKNFFLRLIKIS